MKAKDIFFEEEIYSCQNANTFILELGVREFDCIQPNLF